MRPQFKVTPKFCHSVVFRPEVPTHLGVFSTPQRENLLVGRPPPPQNDIKTKGRLEHGSHLAAEHGSHLVDQELCPEYHFYEQCKDT